MWRVRVMKAADIRRTLFVLLLFCGGLMVYFLFQQPTTLNIPSFNEQQAATLPKTDKKTDVRWTWKCINHRCEKILMSEWSSAKSQSLATCNMLCSEVQLWPLPSGPIKTSSETVTFSFQQVEFESHAKDPALSLLEQSYGIFNENLVTILRQPYSENAAANVNRFRVKVIVNHSEIVRLKLSTDESYNLTVNHQGNDVICAVHANTFFGARHGLETLSQLIWWDDGNLRIISNVYIQDVPKFSYRGVMIDTARNFMSLTSLKRSISAMSANKLNVFHWHISDSQSFPLEIPSVPEIHEYGAYNADSYYSVQDVKELVEYARLRGVRVVIEVDTPAHAGNGWTWGPIKGLGDLAVCVNAQPWYLYCGEPPCGQLNPENPYVYDILEKIYTDILEMTQEDEIFHIGGDEVNLDCWEQHMNRNMSAANYTDLHNLWGEFTLKILSRLQKANGGKKIPYTITWSSNLSRRPYSSKYLDKRDIVVQSWGASEWYENKELLTDGYKLILSHVNAWYLDCGFGKWRERGDAACDPYRPWQTVYSHQPWGYDTSYKTQTLGAEVCLWSEQVDEVSLDTRLWPRAAAFAERIWTDPKLEVDSYGISESVYTRLSTHRERLISRGISVEAMWPQYCTQNPGTCL
ncbi:probable beta-hexosaminidase fdl isoform X1 [Onthophagus taurus]|uniref:probable beta-hexosaminidase fdl isoform X1 n=2 Tax=Onthophagus taurus TaxID=166361 RepID=UPI0039BEAB4F